MIRKFKRNWLVSTMALLAILAGGLCLSAVVGDPYEEGDGEFVFCDSYQEVLEWRDADVGKPFRAGATISEKDNAGRIGRYLFTAETVSDRKMFNNLDLSGRTGTWNMAILVDDAVTVTVVPLDGTTPPATLPRCQGSALWSDAAFHVLSYPFQGGKNYRINFDYSNTCHMPHPDIMEDYDGIIAYVYPATVNCPACNHAMHAGAPCQTAGCDCGRCPECHHAAHEGAGCPIDACDCGKCSACHHAAHEGAACLMDGCDCGKCTACHHAAHAGTPCLTEGCDCGKCPDCHHARHLPNACPTTGCDCGKCPHCHHATHLPTACPETDCPCPATYLLNAAEIVPTAIRVGSSATATLEFLRRTNCHFIDGTTGTYTVAWSFQVRYKPLQTDAWQEETGGCATVLSHVETQTNDPIIYDKERLTFTPNKPGYWEIAAIATTTRVPNALDGTPLASSRTVKTWTVTAWDFGMTIADPSLENVWLTPAQALNPGAMMSSGGEMITVNLVCAPADYLQGQITLTKTSGVDLQFWIPEDLAATPPQPRTEWTGTAAKMLYVGGTAPGPAMLHAEFLPTGATQPLSADAKVTIVKLDISPDSGSKGTTVSVKMTPEGLNLLTAGTTISGTGKFCPVPASLGDSGETTVTYPAAKVNTATADEASIVIGDVGLNSVFEGLNTYRFANATGGVCRLSKVEIATPSGRKFAKSFDFTPLCFSGTLEICTMATNANGMEVFTPSSTFDLGQSLYIQSEIVKVAGATPPSSLTVKVQSLDVDGNQVTPSGGCAFASYVLTLQIAGETNDKYIYRSDVTKPVVPWNGGVTQEMSEGAYWFYYVNDGKLEVKYEDQ